MPVDDITAAAARGVVSGVPFADDGSLVVRLPAHGDIVGVLVLHRCATPFTPGEVRLAETFASFAGIALDRLRRVELERQLIAELQRTIDQRQEFVASVSHELRTPLACILGFAETLTVQWQGLPDEDRLNLVGRMNRHSVELHALVDQLLEVAARQKGRQPATIGTLSLREMVEEVLDDLSPLLAERAVSVDVPLLEVSADRHLVEERGVGIPRRELQRVFEPFWRGANATSSAARGTGIGLSLVKEYVNAMGGEVDVASEPGVGSTFSFTLPLAALPARA